VGAIKFCAGRAPRAKGESMSESNNQTVQYKAFTRRQALMGTGVALGTFALGSVKTWARTEEEVSHAAEAIHQEPVFKANRKRVYEALTDAKQFDKVIQLSAA